MTEPIYNNGTIADYLLLPESERQNFKMMSEDKVFVNEAHALTEELYEECNALRNITKTWAVVNNKDIDLSYEIEVFWHAIHSAEIDWEGYNRYITNGKEAPEELKTRFYLSHKVALEARKNIYKKMV